MSANDEQVGGTHYKDMAIQPWDAMRAWMSTAQFAGFLLGNVIKYAARHHEKGGVEDLRKARHYLDKLIEVHEETASECASVLRAAVDAMDWPGPDWSQAPEWATAWAIDQDGVASWFNGPMVALNPIGSATGDGYWFDGLPSAPAPLFNYPGHWRDSLRRRPTPAA